jgi:hypothetical protein
MSFEAVSCPLCGSDEAYPALEWQGRRMVNVTAVASSIVTPGQRYQTSADPTPTSGPALSGKNEWGIGELNSSSVSSTRSQIRLVDC